MLVTYHYDVVPKHAIDVSSTHERVEDYYRTAGDKCTARDPEIPRPIHDCCCCDATPYVIHYVSFNSSTEALR